MVYEMSHISSPAEQKVSSYLMAQIPAARNINARALIFINKGTISGISLNLINQRMATVDSPVGRYNSSRSAPRPSSTPVSIVQLWSRSTSKSLSISQWPA